MLSVGGSSGNQSCYWGISDGVQVDVALAQSLTPVQSGSYDAISSVSRQFTYTSTQTNRIFKLIVKEASSGGASSNCAVPASTNRYWAMKVTPLNQPSNSALYVEGPVKASATGAAIPAGYVGETISATTSSSYTASTTLGTFSDITGLSITLTPGVWRIVGKVGIAQGCWISGGALAYSSLAIRTGSTTVEKVSFLTYGDPAGATFSPSKCDTNGGSISYIVSPTTSTTYKLSVAGEAWAGTPVYSLDVRSDVVASNIIAVRLN